MAVKTNCTINGKNYYRASLVIGYDSKGKKIVKQFYGNNKTEAEKKRDAYRHDIKNGIDVTSKAIQYTLNEAFGQWLFNVIMPSGIKTSTFETYETLYRLYIKDSKDIGIKKVVDIKAIAIQTYLNKLYHSGKKYTLLSKLTKLLKRFFNYEIENDIIIKNPCMSIKVPGQINYLKEKNSNELVVFSSDERNMILGYLYKTNNRIAGIAYLAFSLGMRQGEILALSWDDVDTERRIINIKRSLRYTRDFDKDGNKIGGSMKLTIPKTMTSVREIEYTESFDSMWKRAKTQNDLDILKAGNSYNNEHNLIFTTALGGPILKKYVLREWSDALKTLELPYRPFHTTRHTFVTQMAIDGVPESITQAIVGHKKGSEITHKIYTHINRESTKKALENFRINVPTI
ncbi:tyrosine-type recombinase/integrase [Clostridium sp. UBA1652]|uniref:tyrosine-type recombinase/integrase n=1 Tax=Clostridium sp. UBA1652 TaxID=1946348 RepID=UPI002580D00B|nr:site-specific integrase [Clostridium sp. UBA1652]